MAFFSYGTSVIFVIHVQSRAVGMRDFVRLNGGDYIDLLGYFVMIESVRSLSHY